MIIWDRNNAIDIGEWSIWESGRLERFYCTVPTMGSTLNGPFRGGRYRELKYHYNRIIWAVIWDLYKVWDTGEWSTCGGERFERFYYITL